MDATTLFLIVCTAITGYNTFCYRHFHPEAPVWKHLTVLFLNGAVQGALLAHLLIAIVGGAA